MSVGTLDDLLAERGGVRGRRVLVRADLNVPLEGGRVADDSRIQAALGTLRRLLAAGARVVLASHLGRPKGAPKPALSLRPVAERLAALLGRPVAFVEACVGPTAEAAVAKLGDGELLLLENLRFHAEEEKNDPGFAKQLAALADVYVNDAFGTAHRAHASTAGVVPFVKRAVAGDLLREELEHLRVVREPERPLVCFLGGAKVSDKLAVLDALAPHTDVLAIGGAMAYTFLLAQGQPTGASLVEPERADDARRVLAAARAAGRELLLPVDHVVAERIEAGVDDARGEGDPGRLARRRHRPRDRGALRRRGEARPHDLLERTDGRLRDRRLRARHRGRGPRHRGVVRALGGGRRRLPRGGEQARPLGSHRPPLDGRWRLARVRAGAGAARRRRAGAAMRRPVVAANWKMYKTVREAEAFAGAFLPRVTDVRERRDRARPALPRALRARPAPRRERGRARGPERERGEAGRLHRRGLAADAGRARLRLLHRRPQRAPHPLRRGRRGRRDGRPRRCSRTASCPIVCVGETLEQREQGRTAAVVKAQLAGSLAAVPNDRAAEIVVAYEPIWAIGTGKTATPELAQEVHALIRAALGERFGAAGDRIRIQYGGSVKPDNAAALLAQKDIDGALVGGASLEPESFAQIVRAGGKP